MEMNTISCGSSFACNGQYFAIISIDNRLRIWDTTSGKLIQEFSPSVDIESTCTCLCWTRESHGEFDNRKKDLKDGRKRKRKLRTEESIPSSDLQSIVLGAQNGKLLLYNPIAGEANGTYAGGHVDSVNCISFHNSRNKLYSCSRDRYIIEWSYDKKEVISKWKADKNSVHRICLGPSGNTLLSAGMSIKLWNLKTKELIMRFNGHSSPVSLLQFSEFCTKKNNPEFDDGYYFLSGSKDDRVVNAWNINLSKPEKLPIAAYMLSDSPQFMKSAVLQNSEKPLQLFVGCRDGKIFQFTSTLNGKTNRPIEHSKSLEILQRENKDVKTTPSTFINGHLSIHKDLMLNLVCGPYIRPSFCSYNFTKLDSAARIVNEVSQNLLLNKLAPQSESTKIMAKTATDPKVIQNTLILPGMGSQKKIVLDVNGNEEAKSIQKEKCDKKKESQSKTEISMEERINDMYLLSSMRPNNQKTPNAASFSQMLIQGLHTSDYNMVNNLLNNPLHDEKIIFNTVERIPVKLITKLLQFMVEELHRSPLRAKSMGLWIRTVLSVHFGHLSSLADNEITDALGKLFSTLKGHEEIYIKLAKLQGKMDLLISHVDKTCDRIEEEVNTTPAIVFNDDSDDEALFKEMDDDVKDPSENEDSDQDSSKTEENHNNDEVRDSEDEEEDDDTSENEESEGSEDSE